MASAAGSKRRAQRLGVAADVPTCAAAHDRRRTSTSEERNGRKESDLVPWRKSKSEARHRQSEKARGTEARQSTADLTGGGGTAARRGISRDAPGVYRRRASNRIQDGSEFRSRGHGMLLSRDKVSPSWPQNHAFFFVLEPELLGAGPPPREESIPGFLSRSDKNKCPRSG